MAVTIARVKRVVRGNERARYVDVTGPASYTTNGEVLSAADIVNLTDTGGVIGNISYFAGMSTGGHLVVLDVANSKVKYYNGTTEIANATNLSAVVARVHVVYGIVNG